MEPDKGNAVDNLWGRNRLLRRPIFTALSPNTEWDDVRLALGLLLQLWKWREGRARQELEEQFRKWLGVRHVFAWESGRSCLYAILSSLGLHADDEVILQAYTCVAVPNAALWAGAKPVYVDIEEATFNMSPDDLERKITPRAKALIIQHTFGLPADIDRLFEIAKRHNLFVIEDCAHALGAEYRGKKVGTFGDAAFFSFGRDKVLSSVFGGVAVTNDEIFAERLQRFYINCPLPSRLWIAQQLLQPVITFLARKTYSFFWLGKVILAVSGACGFLSRAVEPIEKHGGKPNFILKKMPNALARLALHQLAKHERFNAHRQEIARCYSRTLPGMQRPAMRQSLFLRYTLRSPRASAIIEKAKTQKIFLGDWYSTAVAPKGVDYEAIGYDPNSCPVAERVATESFNLPTDIHIELNDAERLVNFLRENL